MQIALLVALGVFAVFAALTTVWSLVWDLKAYKRWRTSLVEAQSRSARRRQERAGVDADQDERRWRWHMLALKCSLFGFVAGFSAFGAGYYLRLGWMLVTGANLVLLGLFAWIAYQLVLPKPQALRQKRLPFSGGGVRS